MALILRSSGSPLTNDQIDGNFTYLRDNAGLTGDVVSTGNATTVNKINGVTLSGLATGILRNTTGTGVPVIAVASDFPTLNQNTTGSAATLTTARNINGIAFDGSQAITIKATATNPLTISTGLIGTSYDGSSAVTITIDSTVALRADTHYIGTTSVALNRTSSNLALTGILSVTMQGSTSGSVQLIPTAAVGTGTILTIPATTGTIITSGDTSTVTNTMLAGSIANTKLTNSSLTVGTTSISLGSSSTTLAGLTSVTSTGFTGALTGNASTATTLATARNINGISFNGSADITIKATATNILTIGTGLIGTSYDGSSAITVAIDSSVALRADTHYIGTTSVALNRTSSNLALAGISSVTLPGSTSGTVQLVPVTAVGTGTVLTIPATTGTIITSGDSATVTNTMLAGSIANSKLINSSLTVGTTSISLGSSSTTLAGLTSVTLAGSTSGTVQLIPTAIVGTGTVLTIPATSGTIVTTGDSATVTNTMLAGSIANAKLTNSSLTVGTTSISLGSSSTTLAGLTSVTSTGFTGALTGNASTATTLATARNINGVSFNGSADITIAIPLSSGITGLATGIATFLATPTSANLATAVTDETGTGLLVFNTSPVISTSLTTASTSFSLLNTNATTVNFAGAATTLSMGASTGTSTVNNDLVVSGNLTVNGTTTTINTSTLVVDDKNIELGAVPSATISTTGTVGTITGTGPWSAVITGMTSTTGLIVGSSLSATNGTGSLGGSGSYIVTSIDSKTQITYSATGGTTPTAGTITTITTTGYNDITANGAGITVKGVTDKTLNWVGTTTAWTSSENLDIASGKSYFINGTNVLSSTTLGSGVLASSLTSVGTLTSLSTSGQFVSTLANNTATGGGQIYLNGATGNRIDFIGNGSAVPAFTTRSVGTKIVLYPNLSASTADYALGIEPNAMWSSVASSGNQFKWYAGTTNVATLSGTGTFSTSTLTSTVATGTAPFTVTSTTNVANLNASSLNGATFASPGTIGSTTSDTGKFTTLEYTSTLTGGTGVVAIGTNQIYKDASGNVGIGTSSPSTTLHVKGGGNPILKLETSGNVTTGGYNYVSFLDSSSLQTGFIGYGGTANLLNIANNLTNGSIVFNTGASYLERMRIDSSGNVGIGTSTIASRLSIKGTTTTDAPTLGTEFITGGTWTSTGWTGDNTTGWVNGASNATALSYSVAAVSGTKYQIAYTVTGYSAGSFTISFGGQSQAGITATGTFGPTATTTGNLVITPTATFVGTIVISIKAITAVSTALITALDSSGTSRFEVRASSTANNTFLGVNSGRYNTTGIGNSAVGLNALPSNTTGSYNNAVGIYALYSNTTGYSNSAVGNSALYSNTTGYSNSAVGNSALLNNTTGYNNSAVGLSALYSNTTGGGNSAVGNSAHYSNTTGNQNSAVGGVALYSNITGSHNTVVGNSALYSNTTGSNNVSLGYQAGRYIADGTTALTVVNNSTYLGYNTTASADSVTNETVIGYNATGAGSNTTVIGTSATVSTTLFGNIIINNGVVGSATLTTSATTASQVIDSNSSTVYRSVKYDIQITSSTSYHSCTVKIIHDGTNAYITQYGDLYTGAVLATFDADISGGNLRLLTTPTNAVTVYKVIKTLINI